MYKATRELIKARQPHTDYVVEVVSVKQIGGGVLNQCFQNSTDDEMLDEHQHSKCHLGKVGEKCFEQFFPVVSNAQPKKLE